MKKGNTTVWASRGGVFNLSCHLNSVVWHSARFCPPTSVTYHFFSFAEIVIYIRLKRLLSSALHERGQMPNGRCNINRRQSTMDSTLISSKNNERKAAKRAKWKDFCERKTGAKRAGHQVQPTQDFLFSFSLCHKCYTKSANGRGQY